MTPDLDASALAELEKIHQLKARYVRAIDTHDLDLIGACFTADAVFDTGGGVYVAHGRDEIAALFRGLFVPGFVTHHLVAAPEIELIGPRAATGVWKLEYWTYDSAARTELHGTAFYYDLYRRIADEWLMSECVSEIVFETRRASPESGWTLTSNPTNGRRRNPPTSS